MGENMEFVIKEFVDKLTEEDINNFALKEGVKLTDEELKVIYLYIRNYWQVFYKGDATSLFHELKEKLSPKAYDKVLELYNKYKRK